MYLINMSCLTDCLLSGSQCASCLGQGFSYRPTNINLIPGCATSPRCGSTRAAKTSLEANSTARVDPTASKVAPASREAGPPGSACPPEPSAVCAVDAELKAASMAVKGDPSRMFGTVIRNEGWYNLRGTATLM